MYLHINLNDLKVYEKRAHDPAGRAVEGVSKNVSLFIMFSVKHTYTAFGQYLTFNSRDETYILLHT